MEDRIENEPSLCLEESALENLMHVTSKERYNNSCFCYRSTTKKDFSLCGWSSSDKISNKKPSRSQKKATGLPAPIAAGKRKTNRSKQNKTSNEDEKCYFRFQDTRKQHIEEYRKEFSTVRKADTIADHVPDPYMPDRGNQGNLAMRVKLLETLTELYKYNIPIRDTSMTSNGLPPVRIANPRQLSLSTLLKPKQQRKLNNNNRQSNESTTNDACKATRCFKEDKDDAGDEHENDNPLRSFNTLSLADSDSDGDKSVKRVFRCSPAQDEDLDEMEASSDAQFSNSILLRPGEFCRKAEKRFLNVIKPTQHFQNAACTIGLKDDATNRRIPRAKSPFSLCLNKLLSPNNRPRRQSTDRFDRRASLKERAGVSNRGKTSPLYISILGKSPICREFCDGSN